MEELIKLPGGSEDELVNELLDDLSPFLVLPQEANFIPSADSQLPWAADSGPAIDDMESSLSYSSHGFQSFHHEVKSEAHRISVLERGHPNKAYEENNKYTLSIKSYGDVMADDGYKWRKYGQKSIKNSPYPRSYYRCTNPRCSAKKQVERSIDDPDTLIITYEGLHLHFTYPFFFLNHSTQPHHTDQPTKKQKLPMSEAQNIGAETTNGLQEGHLNPGSDPTEEFEPGFMGQQGLLEDVVPLMIRKPLIHEAATSSFSSSSASHESRHSSPASSNSFSWSSAYSYLGLI